MDDTFAPRGLWDLNASKMERSFLCFHFSITRFPDQDRRISKVWYYTRHYSIRLCVCTDPMVCAVIIKLPDALKSRT